MAGDADALPLALPAGLTAGVYVARLVDAGGRVLGTCKLVLLP